MKFAPPINAGAMVTLLSDRIKELEAQMAKTKVTHPPTKAENETAQVERAAFRGIIKKAFAGGFIDATAKEWIFIRMKSRVEKQQKTIGGTGRK